MAHTGGKKRRDTIPAGIIDEQDPASLDDASSDSTASDDSHSTTSDDSDSVSSIGTVQHIQQPLPPETIPDKETQQPEANLMSGGWRQRVNEWLELPPNTKVSDIRRRTSMVHSDSDSSSGPSQKTASSYRTGLDEPPKSSITTGVSRSRSATQSSEKTPPRTALEVPQPTATELTPEISTQLKALCDKKGTSWHWVPKKNKDKITEGTLTVHREKKDTTLHITPAKVELVPTQTRTMSENVSLDMVVMVEAASIVLPKDCLIKLTANTDAQYLEIAKLAVATGNFTLEQLKTDDGRIFKKETNDTIHLVNPSSILREWPDPIPNVPSRETSRLQQPGFWKTRAGDETSRSSHSADVQGSESDAASTGSSNSPPFAGERADSSDERRIIPYVPPAFR